MSSKARLRLHMRRQRRALSQRQQRHAARQLMQQLHQSARYLAAQHIALYLVNDGEIDTRYLLNDLKRRGKKVYLPCLHPFKHGHLLFVRYRQGSRMTTNRYGIAEPDIRFNRRMPARFLNVVCLPLVAFDSDGNRLGMGGGYYDRSFAFMVKGGQKPMLIGCAHECQRVEHLPTESWDIPLSAIATDHKLRFFTSPERNRSANAVL